MKKRPFLWKIYILEPRKLALIQTTMEPIHMITKIDVMIACYDYSVLKAKVVDKSKHNRKGPHKSPLLANRLHFLSSFACFYFLSYLSAGMTAYLNFVTIFCKSLLCFTLYPNSYQGIDHRLSKSGLGLLLYRLIIIMFNF